MSRQYNHRLDPKRRDRLEERDLLERSNLASAIANEVMGTSEPSQIIGVYGSWGSGKTFLLDNVVDEIFEDRDNIRVTPIVAVFEAWRFEQEGDLALALAYCLSQVHDQFTGLHQNPQFTSVDEDWEQRGRRLMHLLAKSGSSLAALVDPSLSIPAWVLRSGLDALDTPTVGDPGEEEDATLVPTIERVHDAMNGLVQKIRLASGAMETSRIVMLIDDLDRCSPERLVNLLEWLKLHLTVPGISYIVALDHVAAARAIVGRYKTYLGDSTDLSYGYRYLEKIVDVEFELGPSGEIEQMVASRIFGPKVESVSQGVLELVGRDLPSVQESAELLRFPGLRAPRTCLKVVDRFKRCLTLFGTERGQMISNELPASWAIWLFVLCAMYYRISAERMTEFVRGEGPLVAAWDGGNSAGLGEASTEFVSFAAGWRSRSGGQSARLAPEQMLVLANAVRQLVLPREQQLRD